MDYAFLSKEGRGSQVVMEKAEGSGDRHVSGTQAKPMLALIDSYMSFKSKFYFNQSCNTLIKVRCLIKVTIYLFLYLYKIILSYIYEIILRNK